MTLTISNDNLTLIFWGATLFLVGLVQGVFIGKFRNPRMALAGHLTAVQCGMALMIFGVIWALVDLPQFWLDLTRLALIWSVYVIWLGISISAVTGASRALPIAGAGFSAGPLGESLVLVLEGVGVTLSLAAGAMVVAGLPLVS